MTHYEKLNAILHVLLHKDQKGEFRKQATPLTFAWICKTVAEVEEEWEVTHLRKILLGDGYIVMGQYGDGEPPGITHAGIKFIQSGGYIQAKKDIEVEREIKQKTLKKFRYDKAAFWIAILTFMIATSLNIYNFRNGQGRDREINFLKERLNKVLPDTTNKKK